MIRMMNSSPAAMNRPISTANHERKKQACEIIQVIITELIPTLDQVQAKKVALQLSSLRAIQSAVCGSNEANSEASMRQTLRLISRRILKIARDSRERSIESPPKVMDDMLSVCSEATPKINPSNILISKPHDDSAKSFPAPYDHEAKASRHHLMINLLGESKYNEIICIAEEVKSIRYKSATWTKFSRFNACNGLLLEDERELPASKTLPQEIYDLYFQTRLLDVMKVVDSRSSKQLSDLPEACSCIVEQVNWNNLLEDAKIKLDAFKRFERENVDPDDQLSFNCYNGLCGRK